MDTADSAALPYLKCKAGGKMGGNPLAPVQYAPHDCEKARASNCKRAGTQMDEPESCQNSPHATQRHNVHRRSTFETHGWITPIRDGPVRGASSSASERERMQNASPWRSVGSRGPEVERRRTLQCPVLQWRSQSTPDPYPPQCHPCHPSTPAGPGQRPSPPQHNSTVTIEEFHGRLQEATNFPLRPFVIPFLKANLPLLQRELLHCARAAKQTPAQYLSQHEHLLLSTTMASPPDSSELLLETNENGKRRSPDRGKENGFHERVPVAMEPPAKRICTISPAPRHSPALSVPLPLNTQHHPTPPPLQHYALEDVTGPHNYRDPQRLLEARDVKERPRHPGTNGGYREEPMDHRLTEREWADEWRHLDHVLNCIVDMVEKTRRSIAVLRRCQEADREEMHYWRRRSSEHEEERKSTPSKQSSPRGGGDSESQFTPRSGYVPDEIWRKAEEAVNEVKRQAMGEVQKAVAEAEQKALELVTVERARMEKTLAEAKRQATKDAIQVINEQEDSSESCWNCGRKASETCSGCNAARYCGSFCQHKDWERHHLICSPGLQAQPKPPSAVPGRAAGKFPDSMATASPAMEKITTTASRASTPASVSAAETNGH
ncbi:UNVERIFIED_CONTAM: hypothetical protein FKN15_051083 [Acipenser sinensis]